LDRDTQNHGQLRSKVGSICEQVSTATVATSGIAAGTAKIDARCVPARWVGGTELRRGGFRCGGSGRATGLCTTMMRVVSRHSGRTDDAVAARGVDERRRRRRALIPTSSPTESVLQSNPAPSLPRSLASLAILLFLNSARRPTPAQARHAANWLHYRERKSKNSRRVFHQSALGGRQTRDQRQLVRIETAIDGQLRKTTPI